MGILGILIGTWMGLDYGREWGRAPTPFAGLFSWVMFGLPGFAVGGANGAADWRLLASLRLGPPALAASIGCSNKLIFCVAGPEPSLEGGKGSSSRRERTSIGTSM